MKAEIVAVNENKTLKVIVPALTPGTAYSIRIYTMSSAKSGSTLLKTMREAASAFSLTAQTP